MLPDLFVEHQRQRVVLGLESLFAAFVGEDRDVRHDSPLKNKNAGGLPRLLEVSHCCGPVYGTQYRMPPRIAKQWSAVGENRGPIFCQLLFGGGFGFRPVVMVVPPVVSQTGQIGTVVL